MKLNTFTVFLGCSLSIFSFPASQAGQETQALPAILSDETIVAQNHLPDFSYAGYRNGTADLPQAAGSILSVDDFGAVPNDGKDDTKAVLKAIEKANRTKGAVILRFSPGRYRITEVLKIERSDIVLSLIHISEPTRRRLESRFASYS